MAHTSPHAVADDLWPYPSPVPPQTLPAWKEKFPTVHWLRDYEELKKPLDKSIDRWPKELGDFVNERWQRIAGEEPTPIDREHFKRMHAANEDLTQLALELDLKKLDIGTSDQELIDYANQCVAWCTVYPRFARFIVQRAGLKVPDGKGMTEEGKLLRIQDRRWWCAQLRKTFGQTIENALRKKGMVCRTRAAYATDWAVSRRKSQKANNAKAMKAASLSSDAGDQLSLFDVAEKSISNPALRRGELMTRANGFEKIALESGHIWTFATLTAPSAFHAVNYNKRRRVCYDNDKFDGSSVRDSQAWHVRMWGRARAKLARQSLQYYGFRVAEPHHDGTVHWHMLLFCAPHQMADLKRVITSYWLSEYADEQGATEHRVKWKDEDKGKPGSSAAGYLTKYIAKNIDGFEIDVDLETGKKGDASAARVDAWASVHRIRQFQQLGGPPVGLWREVRRIREAVEDTHIEAARIASNKTEEHKASFAEFIKAVGGIGAGRKTIIQLIKQTPETPTRYREPALPKVSGVASPLSQIITRVKRWVIKWGSESLSNLGPVPITVRHPDAVKKHAGIELSLWFERRSVETAKARPSDAYLRWSAEQKHTPGSPQWIRQLKESVLWG